MNVLFISVVFFILVSIDSKELRKKNQKKLLTVYAGILLLGFTLWLMYFLRVDVPSINRMITTIVQYLFTALSAYGGLFW
ncbi:hypothetical protein RJD24_03310 [Bacillaceae bacterium IKA-2]|nr:hypothetical protein RJD24_03310 [Bacillaceae bacterium IKA-2]